MTSPKPAMLQAIGNRRMPRQFRRREPNSTGRSPMPVETTAMNMPTQPVTARTITMMMTRANVETCR